MLFPTVEYAIFFLAVFWASWFVFVNNGAKKAFLLMASYVFYGFWDWAFVPLLFAISFVGFVVAYFVQTYPQSRQRKTVLTLGVIVCLLVLFYYKYVGFFLLNVVNIAAFFGQPVALDVSSPLLPLGVSFFVFHAISLMGDAYKNKVPVKITLLDSLLYVAFFPQLIAGPILRASNFLPQLARPPSKDKIRLGFALFLIISGLIKKVLISNYLATWLVDDVFAAPDNYNAIDILFAVYGYAVQIYCDFSGYTSIATGCALLLGYEFPKNFDAPYTAANPQEFWHRWHISLSTWLRDYLYIPLGGSRVSEGRTYVNLFITMVLGGLWHGASWTFVIWGCLHGAYLVVHRYWASLGGSVARLRNQRSWHWLSRLLLFHAICVSWVLFRATDFDNAWAMFRGLGRMGSSSLLTPLVLFVLCVGLFAQYRPKRWDKLFELELSYWSAPVVGVAVAVAIWLIDILGPTGIAPFIYFQF